MGLSSSAVKCDNDFTGDFPYLAARLCPNCGSKQEERPAISADLKAEHMPREAIGNAWRGLFIQRTFFSYYRCSACNLLFAPTYLTPAALQEFYSNMGDNMHSGDERLSRLTQKEYCEYAAPYLPQARTYCEIGPDIGHFLQAAKEKYALEEAVLIEPNQAVWPQLRNTAAGLKTIIASTAEECMDNIPNGSIDLVVAIHVLDHLLVPAKTLQWIKRVLSPRGIAVFVVHNERSLLPRLLGARWPAYILQHPQLYNPATLKETLEHQGLRVKAVLRTSNQFPLGYLIEHGVFAILKKRFSFSRLTLPVKIKLGNIMAIASSGGA